MEDWLATTVAISGEYAGLTLSREMGALPSLPEAEVSRSRAMWMRPCAICKELLIRSQYPPPIACGYRLRRLALELLM